MTIIINYFYKIQLFIKQSFYKNKIFEWKTLDGQYYSQNLDYFMKYIQFLKIEIN